MISKVEFLTGYGDDGIILDVLYIADGFARDKDSLCAFCHGDPCNESSDEDSEIAKFFARNPKAPTCPCCKGRAS